ncbi:hypothetical protein [Undibacterium danionis]|uniref:Uncharacterized protein n=1 Tax=Undibacterium danionis TaxID=1812100 RepID=A0ABV6IFW9_9BURK
MDYQASSVSMAGGIGGSSSNANGSSGSGTSIPQSQNFSDAKGGNVTPGLPSQTKGSDQSTTYATISEGSISIAGKSTTAKALVINTDAAKANQQIATTLNIKDILKEQQAMSAAARTVISTSKQVAGDIANNAAKTQDKAQKIIDDKTSTPEQIVEAKKVQAEAKQTQSDWSAGGIYNQALGVVTALTVDKTAGQGGAATANAVGAVVAKQIGDIAKAKDWEEGSPEKVILHRLAGLVQAKLGGTSELSGLTAGATKEALTPVMESFLKSQGYSYGSAEFNDMMKLGSTLIGATVGGLVGNGALDINSGANVTLIAEQSNRKLHPNDYKLAKALASKGIFKEEEILDALRWSGITDGKKLLVEAGHKEAYAVGSDGRVLNITKNEGWVSSSEMAGVSLEPIKGEQLVLKEVLPTAPSAEIIAFIKANTGDTSSPYVLLPAITPKPSITSSLPAVSAGLTRATVMVDGVAYFPLKAECPQGCFDSIAHGIDDPGTLAYERALDDKLARDAVMFGLGLLDPTKIGFGLGRSAAGVGVAKGTVGRTVTREVVEGAIIVKTATNDAIGTTGLINSTRTATSVEVDVALRGVAGSGLPTSLVKGADAAKLASDSPNITAGNGSTALMDGHKIYDPNFNPLSANPSATYRLSDPAHRPTGADVYFGENVSTSYFEVR